MATATENYKPTLIEWDRRVCRSVECHYESAKKLRNRHYLLGVPAIVIVTLMGALKDVDFNDEIGPWITLFYRLICVTAAVLVALQTFLNFSQRAEKHREAASEYGSVRREIEHIYKRIFERDSVLEDCLKNIRTRLDILSKTTPEVPSDIWTAAKIKYQIDKFKSKLC